MSADRPLVTPEPVNPYRRGLLLAGSLFCLGAHAAIPPFTEKKLPVEGPLDTFDLLLSIGTFQRPGGGAIDPINAKQRAALERLIPAILAKNGLQLPVFKSVGNDAYVDEFLRQVEQVDSPRYVLSIQSVRYETSQAIQTVWFETKLIDRTVRKTAWTLRLGWRLVDSQPNIRAEETAGILLRFMAQDGLIKLSEGGPIDLKGRPIERHSVFATDFE